MTGIWTRQELYMERSGSELTSDLSQEPPRCTRITFDLVSTCTHTQPKLEGVHTGYTEHTQEHPHSTDREHTEYLHSTQSTQSTQSTAFPTVPPPADHPSDSNQQQQRDEQQDGEDDGDQSSSLHFLFGLLLWWGS